MQELSTQIKLIVSDLDGTLISSNGTLDTDMVSVKKELDLLGIKFTVATGRNKEIVREIARELNITIPYICNNGGMIVQNDQPILTHNIKREELKVIMDTLVERNYGFVCTGKKVVYRFNKSEKLEFYITRINKELQVIADATVDGCMFR